MTAAIVIVTLLLADLLVLGLLALLTHHRRNRRSFDRHVDSALQVLGTRRPQDGLEDR